MDLLLPSNFLGKPACGGEPSGRLTYVVEWFVSGTCPYVVAIKREMTPRHA